MPEIKLGKEWLEGLIDYSNRAEDTFDKEIPEDVKKLIKHKLSELFGYIESVKYLLI